MTEGGELLSARTRACAKQPGSPLYLCLPFARALSPLPACNSAQISEEAGRLIFCVCMAKERGRTLTPGSQLLNPLLNPAEGRGKNLSALASCWCEEGFWDPVAVPSLGLHTSRLCALTAGPGVLEVDAVVMEALGKSKSFPQTPSSNPQTKEMCGAWENRSLPCH